MDDLRAVSNLSIPAKFKLPKPDMRKGFMAMYGRRFPETPYMLFNTLIYQTLFMAARHASFGKVINKGRREKGYVLSPSHLTKSVLRRVDDLDRQGFEYTVDVAQYVETTETAIQKTLVDFMGDAALEQLEKFPYEHPQPRVYHPADLLPFLYLSPHTLNVLRSCVTSIEVKLDERVGAVSFLMTFFISKPEAEFMTCTQFASIRSSQLYLLLQNWLTTGIGRARKVPTSSLSISYISAQVKNTVAQRAVDVRNKIDGIVAMPDGELMYVPDVDNAVNFEQALQDYGQMDDGSYSFDPKVSEDEIRINRQRPDYTDDTSVRKLPANRVVLTDWVNLKFAYTNTSGILSVMDLELAIPLRAFHVRKTLSATYREGLNWVLTVWALIGSKFPDAATLEITDEELQWGRIRREDVDVKDLAGYCTRAIETALHSQLAPEIFNRLGDLKLYHFAENSPVVSLRPVGRAISKIHALMTENMDNILATSAVTTILSLMAKVRIFAKYAVRFDEVTEKDNKDREAYLNQGESPDFKQPALPFLRDNFSFMPHQGKSSNMQRHSPKLTVLNVDAGGGKTLIILTRMLQDVQAGLVKRPLVMCPGHLVSSYVKEAVYLTEGRLNVIPITMYTVRQNGYERLSKMIESAPRNTVFVTDYDFVKNKSETLSYGLRPVTFYRNAEFLRQFRFDEVFCDESHWLKNVSVRSEAVSRLLSEIPYKLLASGTLIADMVTDLVAQFALLDPTVFGDREEFVGKYALETRGGKVISWRPGAMQEIHSELRKHCVFVTCQRKEWAALLPDPHETFYAVDMTPAQQQCYTGIMEKTIKSIEEAAKDRPELRKALDSAKDEGRFENLASMLRPYLARLETYLAAPARDILGQEVLVTPEDRTSPKVKKLIEICRKHIEGGIPGKILVFTGHIAVAEDVIESLPPDLRAKTIHYTAGTKLESASEFENNPNIVMMVGVEKSMNTGLNFQFVSRLIRLETCWTPGETEQGTSRVNRPQLKKLDIRNAVFFDWILVNRSFDITKISRLMAKTIQNSKFYNSGNLAYENLDDVELIPMTLDSISALNDFRTNLAPYLNAYEVYQQVVHEDYQDYKARNADKMDPIPVASSGILPGSKLMTRTPYVPDMAVYGTDDLGLIRYDEFMRQEDDFDEDTDVGGDIGEDDDTDTDVEQLDDGDAETVESVSQRALNAQELSKVSGLGIHCEFGEGVIIGVSRFRLKVQLSDGSIVRPRKLASFVVTRAETNSRDIRKQLLKLSGDLPLEAPVEVPPTSMRVGRGKDRAADTPTPEAVENAPVEVQLYFAVVNDFLGVGYYDIDGNPDAVNALSAIGFRPTIEHYATEIRNPAVLLTLFRTWRDHGFSIPKETNVTFQAFYNALKAKTVRTIGLATKLELRNFFIREYKPSTDETALKPYPLVKDDKFYVALPIRGQLATRKAIQVRVPQVKWERDEALELMQFASTKEEASVIMKKVLSAGIRVTNLGDLKRDFKALKLVRRSDS